ncbi:maleylacetate reductase [Microbacterium aurantiacum]|uniref:maleylacetate reductase n=1 Tax=Microbacterium aurantiacum TaxID=162393 RepID=UPI0040373596
MSLRFDHVTLGQRVRFGAGCASAAVADEVRRLDARLVMLIAGEDEREIAETVVREIDVATWFDRVVQHVPVALADEATELATRMGIDLIVTVGGGSTTGLAKAIALTTGIPIVAVPTTYAGSEATNVWGLTEAERKTTGVDDRVLPVAVVYDPDLTLSLPVGLSVASGLNGIAHCVDSMWAPRADPINRALAIEGTRAVAAGLRAIVVDSQDADGRASALYGAYLSAVAFASAGSGMHHKICHVLGGTFDLPHAPTHAVVLPYVTAFNSGAVPEAAARIGEALGATDALEGLESLSRDTGAPRSLRELGMPEDGVPLAAELALAAIPESNPRTVTDESLRRLLFAAWSGSPARDLVEESTAGGNAS